MPPPTRTARRLTTVIGLIGVMFLTGGADRLVPGADAVEGATTVTGEVRDEAGEDAEASGHNGTAGHDKASDTAGDRLDDLADQATDVADETVDHITDTVDETVTETGDTVDEAVDETTDTVDRVSGDEQDTQDPGPVEEQPPPVDEAPSPGEPPSPADLTPAAAGPSSGAPPEGTPSGGAEAGDGADEPEEDEPGSLFNGGGGFGERAPFPLALMAILAGFLAVQAWVDRRDPKLAAAPFDTEPDLVFERP